LLPNLEQKGLTHVLHHFPTLSELARNKLTTSALFTLECLKFDIDIDWSIIEKELMQWSELFRSGKKLREDLSFNYVDSHPSSASTPRRGNKRGSSATQAMLADRAAQLDAEQKTTGDPSIWREVYALMQCPSPPCNVCGKTIPVLLRSLRHLTARVEICLLFARSSRRTGEEGGGSTPPFSYEVQGELQQISTSPTALPLCSV